MEINRLELDNGIRLIHQPVPNAKVTHCGIILDIGSRDEAPHQQGLAHFWEHMAFKGTKRRRAYHILNRIDSVGGELNAYTTKEKICFYASVLDQHYDKAMDLLTDITFDSVFPESQIERERHVILEEMAMYRDSPEDAIQDDFDQLIYGDHPLGMNILGTEESINSFKRSDFKEFIGEHLNTERLIVSVVSGLPFSKVKRIAEKYLKGIPALKATSGRIHFGKYQPEIKKVKRTLTQAQVAMGCTAYNLHQEEKLPFMMLSNYLGGPAMNSRLNMALREKKGYVYAIEANYSAYTDTGLFSVFFGTEPGQVSKSIRMVRREIEQLRKNSLSSVQLHKIREQYIGQLAMAEERQVSLMLALGKSLLDMDKIESFEEICDQIRSVTPSMIQEVALETLDPDQLSILTYLPN